MSEQRMPPERQGLEAEPPAVVVSNRLTSGRFRWVLLVVAVVVFALLLWGVRVVGDPPGEVPIAVNQASTEAVAADTDGDGLPDAVEEAGWRTQGGGTYRTDPKKADTDGDGLTDGEEAGELLSDSLAERVYAGISDPTKVDSDGDELDDRSELRGWKTQNGGVYRTEPMNPDTDGDGLTDGVEAGELVTTSLSESMYAGISDPTKVDSDGDGLDDRSELRGWKTQNDAVYRTEPMNPDTDGDGLTDGVEAGELLTTSLSGRVYAGISDPTKMDSDEDGLDDRSELRGWKTQRGGVYLTEPMNRDTDGDGLYDGDEAGVLVASDLRGEVYAGFSDPLLVDTDGDGLDDADEADLGLNAFNRDSDDDQIEDGREVQVVDSDPSTADTDGDGLDDGYEDANRQSQGLDPLWADVKVEKWDYAFAFAKGAVAGDLWREESIPWLVGNLASGGASFIPGVGWIVGSIADVRDAIGSAILQDWVGAGFSAVGLVPQIGDAVAIPGKVAKFVARAPKLAPEVATLVVALDKVPDDIKIKTTKLLWRGWDRLREAGLSEKTILRLQKGRLNLDTLAETITRPTHIKGPPARFFEKWQDGEKYVEEMYKADVAGVTKQVRVSTAGCIDVCNSSNVRVLDVLADGIAHESKVGYKTLSMVKKQIKSDEFLIKNGDIEAAHWHFFPSGRTNKVGASPLLLDALDEAGIRYTIHLPTEA